MPFRLMHALWLFCLAIPSGWAVETVEVVTLRYHRAEQVIPLLQPLVGPAGAVTGMQNHLVIRADAAAHAQIRRVLAEVDIAPRRLLITLRQNTSRAELGRDAGVYGRFAGEDGQLAIGDRAAPGVTRVEARHGRSILGAHVTERSEGEAATDTQQLQVLDGGRAFIRLGQAVPFTTRSTYVNPYGATVVDQTQFVDVVSGFEVSPRVSGESVILEIMPQRDSLRPNGEIHTQRAATTLSARLGEWTELGAIDQSGSQDASATLYSQQRSQSDRRGVFIRVDELR